MDAHHLDFPSNEYDIVYGNAILHHLSLDKISKEIYRVLKPGGKAAFREVIKGNIFLQLFRRLTPFWRTPDEHPLVKEDIVLFENIFSKCQIETYMLCGLLYSFFLRMANYFLKKLSPKIIIPEIKLFYSAFDKIDGILFRFMPLLKDQAWLCLIMLRK
jgi:SAM-dependent methyltransferase